MNSRGQLSLTPINLIVGKNASGKSRTIEALRQIADLLAGEIKVSNLVYSSSKYELRFQDEHEEIDYFLDFREGKIRQEILKINEEEKLNRSKKRLFYQEVGKHLSFKIDDNTLAVSRRDSEQQPFFEKLYQWGKNLNHYKFGDRLGRDSFLRDVNKVNLDTEIDLKDGNEVTHAFLKGESLDQEFSKMILHDMSQIGYPSSKIEINSLKHLPIGFGLSLKEEGLDEMTDQLEMSQGMFRALSLLIQLNYSLLAKIPSCILVDDIGEGLDYDRSKLLIELIIEKVKGSSVQVILTTNDRFVMNKIPLEYWSVIQRVKNKAIFYNYENSQQTFDDFEFTGLNNFDFFTSNYYQGK